MHDASFSFMVCGTCGATVIYAIHGKPLEIELPDGTKIDPQEQHKLWHKALASNVGEENS